VVVDDQHAKRSIQAARLRRLGSVSKPSATAATPVPSLDAMVVTLEAIRGS